MKILGISAHYHDSAAALVIDGIPIAAVQEERLSRKKNDAAFPLHAIEWCLEQGKLERLTISSQSERRFTSHRTHAARWNECCASPAI